MADLSPDEIAALIRGMMNHPAMLKLVEADAWAKERGFSTADRTEFNRVLANLVRTTGKADLVREYVNKMMDVFTELGPTLMQAMQSFGK